MNTRRKIWAALTLFVIAFFTAIIPVHVYDRYPMFFAFLAGGLLLITLGQTIGNFDSIYELLEKTDPNEEQSSGKKLAPLAIFPAFIFSIVVIFYNGSRKDDELKQFGILAKGVVANGSSSTTTRRFQKNTTYDLIFTYQDSTGKKYTFEQSVNGSEFDNAYVGQEVDIVYSKKNPSLSRAVLTLSELSSLKSIANNPIEVQQLIGILESTKPDTIVDFLNHINYQWRQGEQGVYANDKRNLAIKVFEGNQELAYMENGHGLSSGSDDFEKSLEAFGFKKKAVTDGDKTQELYYTDKYGVSKENKMIQGEGNAISFSTVTIYHVFLLTAMGE